MLPVLDEIASRQFGVFTSAQALAAGHSRDEVRTLLRTRAWSRRRRGVYCAGDVAARAAGDPRLAHLLDVAAVLVALPRRPAVSHASAAAVHGLLVPRRGLTEVRLTDPYNWRVGRGYRVSQGGLPARAVAGWGPFSVTAVARTLVDCAREWELVDAVVALDDALHRGLTDPLLLRESVAGARHWEGSARAARAVRLADGRAESPLESAGRVQIVTSGLPVPELQVELWDDEGFIGRVDGWYDDAAVALEFDGAVKYLDPRGGRSPGEVLWQEKRREDRMRAAGARPVRIAKADLGAPWSGVRGRLRTLLLTPYAGPRGFRVVRRPSLTG
ncbi:type IV toxin-antitoxin system AbiEi family antitoxin domain-containing protein [Modestobacter sp. KNN46-3]|uniref:type IV toxin-antitoxin system AbiEi family antitoxin domain-containing protein n=1 Tax=Modestobacter sp. KNN46-3 TaxID=2711218 RepID=UPI0013DF5E52|nr:type IV toxin-antitoxin system AbiEi family antitoxin domain-containing protein [Modestobacter sp. KNN46-3]